jgi:hypothetical protein
MRAVMEDSKAAFLKPYALLRVVDGSRVVLAPSPALVLGLPLALVLGLLAAALPSLLAP